jgi:y4mF family transcriptional regulator
MDRLADYATQGRKKVNLTQQEFAEKTGVAHTVIRKIEQGKTNLNLGKVNQVLAMFGHELGPVSIQEFTKVTD